MSESISNTVLQGLQPDTLYTVSVVPIYDEGDGKKMSENGKTSKTGSLINFKMTKPQMLPHYESLLFG